MAALFSSSNDVGAGGAPPSSFGAEFGGAEVPATAPAGVGGGAVPSSSASVPSGGVAGGLSAPNGEAGKPTFAEKETEFEDMVGDMRNAFISWLRRTESQLQDAKLDLIREKESFEDEKSRVWRQFMQEKQQE